MTAQFFNHPLVNLHYYQFGNGPKAMLCFHGYGMHGKQFSILAASFGSEYTFYGFDLFFHQQTLLQNQSISMVKKGLPKADFCKLMSDFCQAKQIDRYSIISYSLGTHYATVLAEAQADKIEQLFILAPAFLNVFKPFKVLAKNTIANFAFRKLFLSKNGVRITLSVCKKIGFLDAKNHQILTKELLTPALRFAFYANVTYLRYLQPNLDDLVNALNENQVRSFFIFGERDYLYPKQLADAILPKLKLAKQMVLDEDHDMVNQNLPARLSQLMYDN